MFDHQFLIEVRRGATIDRKIPVIILACGSSQGRSAWKMTGA
jgi:hypothetical protein